MKKYLTGNYRRITLSLISFFFITLIYVYLCYSFGRRTTKIKIEEKQKVENYSHDTIHDKTMMKLGMAIYRNEIQIYKGNERKADSAYYANYEDILLSIYKESLQIPTK